MNHWKRSFTLTCLWAVLTAGSLAAAQEPRMAAAVQMAMGNAYARGDKTKNAPEIIPQGQRVSYTYEGFTVSFILPANGQPQSAD